MAQTVIIAMMLESNARVIMCYTFTPLSSEYVN